MVKEMSAITLRLNAPQAQTAIETIEKCGIQIEASLVQKFANALETLTPSSPDSISKLKHWSDTLLEYKGKERVAEKFIAVAIKSSRWLGKRTTSSGTLGGTSLQDQITDFDHQLINIERCITKQFSIATQVFPPSVSLYVKQLLLERFFSDSTFGIQPTMDKVLTKALPVSQAYLDLIASYYKKIQSFSACIIEQDSDAINFMEKHVTTTFVRHQQALTRNEILVAQDSINEVLNNITIPPLYKQADKLMLQESFRTNQKLLNLLSQDHKLLAIPKSSASRIQVLLSNSVKGSEIATKVFLMTITALINQCFVVRRYFLIFI